MGPLQDLVIGSSLNNCWKLEEDLYGKKLLDGKP